MKTARFLARVAALCLSLCLCGCAADGSARLFEAWRSSTSQERGAILERCVANDFAQLVGKHRDAVIAHLGHPDLGYQADPDPPDESNWVLVYRSGSWCDNPGSLALDPQVHQALVLTFDEAGALASIRVEFSNVPFRGFTR